MNHREIIRPDGKIRSSDQGDTVASGLTTSELAGQLKLAASQLRDPEVAVSVVEFAAKSIYVAGEVGKPGPIAYQRGLTPLQALAQAGGVLPTALLDSVVLVRAVDAQGRTVSRRLDLESGVLSGVREPVQLAPYDILYVPKSSIAEADVWMDQHVTKLLPFLRGASANARINP
jgi:protein involved in polysaccharide export with SLBB domain